MNQNPETITRKTYDKIAKQFARNTATIDANLSLRMERFVHHLQNNEPILDLGCGPGRDLYWFTQHSIRGIGSDLSFQMLREVQQIIATTTLAQADMRHLPFVNTCFGGIWCNAALIHIPKTNIQPALNEIKRILVPGGAFFVSLQEGSGEMMERYQYLGKKRFFARYTMQEMCENLEKTGFSILHKETYMHKCKWLWFECVLD